MALTVALAVAAGARADGPVDTRKPAARPDAASPVEAAPDTKPATAARDPRAHAGQKGAAAAEPRGFTRISADQRKPRRGRGPGLETTTLPGGSSPWYRSAIGSLAVVLTLVAAAYFVVRRFVPSARASESRLLRVVGRATLSPKHSLALVHLGHRFVVVGVSPDRLDALCEIHDPDEVAELAARAGMNGARRPDGFDHLLVRETRRHRKLDDADDAARRHERTHPATAREPLTDLLSRLRTLRSK